MPAEQVEVAGRGARHRDRHVVLGAQRHEPLDPGRGVVGALALEAVRQQQHHAGALAPLLLAGGDELVEDRLGAVDEVAELGLPADQGAPAWRPSSRIRSRPRRTPTAASRRRGTWRCRCSARAAGCTPRRCAGRTRTRVRLAERAPPVSWPTRRTVCPSIRVEPNASISPVAQSIALCSTMGPGGPAAGCQPRVRGEPLRQVQLGVHDLLDRLFGDRGGRAGVWWIGRDGRRPATTDPGSAWRAVASRVSVKARSSCCW